MLLRHSLSVDIDCEALFFKMYDQFKVSKLLKFLTIGLFEIAVTVAVMFKFKVKEVYCLNNVGVFVCHNFKTVIRYLLIIIVTIMHFANVFARKTFSIILVTILKYDYNKNIFKLSELVCEVCKRKQIVTFTNPFISANSGSQMRSGLMTISSR